jgi:hypothetical protein
MKARCGSKVWLRFRRWGSSFRNSASASIVGVSMILDNTSRTIISNNGTLIFRGSNDVPFWLIEPELRISWRQTFGDHNQFFIEPGVAGGVAFGFLSLNSDEPGGDSFEEKRLHRLRPRLPPRRRAGHRRHGWDRVFIPVRRATRLRR